MSAAFNCGHPSTPENTQVLNTLLKDGTNRIRCAFCQRVAGICRTQRSAQARINKGACTLGERVCAGMA